MALNSRFGTSSAEGKTIPAQSSAPRKVDRLAAQAALLAAKKPSEPAVESMEQAAPVALPPELAARPGSPVAVGDAPTISTAPDSLTGSSSRAPHETRGVVEQRAVDAVRPSPFQPRGRPSAAAVEAVRSAVAEAGSPAALASKDGAPIFSRLEPEAARLAELTYSVAEHGVNEPVEVRIAEDGVEECLSGHRRLAAARLAGRDTVPVLLRGALSNAQAAALVLTGNLHREDFTPWQEAVLVSQVQERRRADGLPSDVRTLGTVMGWSSGKVHHLLKARQSFSPVALARFGNGDAGRVEEGLARLQPAELKRLVEIGDEGARAAATRRAIGWPDGDSEVAQPQVARPVCTHRPKRGGGFVVEVNEPIESLAVGDAALVYELLHAQLARVRTRLEQLGHQVAEGSRVPG